MSNLRLKFKSAENKFFDPSLFTLPLLFFILFLVIGKLFSWATMHADELICSTQNGKPIQCEQIELTFFAYLFITIGISCIFIPIFSCIKHHKQKGIYYNCYTDYIEIYKKTKLLNKYYMGSDATLCLLPQTKNQRIHNTGDIMVLSPMYRPFNLINIAHYKHVHKQLCDLYHITKTSIDEQQTTTQNHKKRFH